MKSPAKMGRPSVYTASWHIPQARLLCELGATLEQIAKAFDVSAETIRRWMLKYTDFCGSIKVGRVPADNNVEMTLYRRATGYQTVETEKVYEMVEMEDPETGELKVIKKLVGGEGDPSRHHRHDFLTQEQKARGMERKLPAHSRRCGRNNERAVGKATDVHFQAIR
ncbi:MAG: hypothetical protein ACR2OL_18880 [Anderseniella sp.]